MKLLVLLLLLASSHSFPTEPTFPEHQTESRLRFAGLDEVWLLANVLLQLGHSLRNFVQKTKNQINDIFQKLNIFDKSLCQLSVLASETKEDEEEEEQRQIMRKLEEIIEERINLKLSCLSQSLLSAEQLAEISMLKIFQRTAMRSSVDDRYPVAYMSLNLKSHNRFLARGDCPLSSTERVFTVIQRRHDGSVDFDLSWEKNEDGFGDFSGGWWFSVCGDINLNGRCNQSRPRKKGTHWKPGRGATSSKASEISISHLTKPQSP
ncbi:angiopoietin-related protein 3-like [Carassius auratus]|uniref:Angiopoietin-related protein 3-like n=1 Tax=Carassius auratus TaxID=7957 RepID=A0A6P6J7D7_CARAU|nr:angiopoietin-related protein 3-like [Carassius auratus]